MTDIRKLTSYNDLRRLLSPEAFTATMNYLAWHNRQKMTPMLEVWQALLVGLLAERQPFDSIHYTSIKSFFGGARVRRPKDEKTSRAAAKKLAQYLAGDNSA